MKRGNKPVVPKSNAESTDNPNQSTHVRNQNENHNTKKVALGPNTKR
jgi:hypothetical protein